MSRQCRHGFLAAMIAALALGASAGAPPRAAATRPAATRPAKVTAPRQARAAATRPTTDRARVSRRNNKTVIPPAAKEAVLALVREFEKGELRAASDYLKTSPNAEMTAEVILTLLQNRCGDSDPLDGYIKWQLLSGLPETLSAEQLPAGLSAYTASPGLIARPGMSDQEKRALDREARHIEDPLELTGVMMREVRSVDLANEPVLKYREALFDKLPDSHDTFLLAFRDLHDRALAGISPRMFCRTLTRRIVEWAPKAPPAEAASLYDAVSELLLIQMPEYYDSLQASRDAGGYTWTRRRPTVNDGGQLELAAEALHTATRNAAPEEPSRRRRR